MADDMWTKFVKKKRKKKDQIWLNFAKNNIRILQQIKPTVCDNCANLTKKNEKTILGPRMAMVYFGILIIKKKQRVAFIVMQYCGNTDYEKILTDVRSEAEPRTGRNKTGDIQMVLVCYGVLSAINLERFPRSGFPKGISVYHRDTSVIVLQ